MKTEATPSETTVTQNRRIEEERSDVQTILHAHRHAIHVPESEATFGLREAPGARRLYVEVRDEEGHVVYQTWQQGPLEGWERVTLYFDRYGIDARGHQIGLSFWA